MNALVRSTSSTLNGRFAGYEPLDHGGATADARGRSWRSLSKRRGEVRTRQRQIFLKSYTLLSAKEASEQSRKEKLRKVAVKVRTVAVSVVGSFRSCNSPSAICASSPVRKIGR